MADKMMRIAGRDYKDKTAKAVKTNQYGEFITDNNITSLNEKDDIYLDPGGVKTFSFIAASPVIKITVRMGGVSLKEQLKILLKYYDDDGALMFQNYVPTRMPEQPGRSYYLAEDYVKTRNVTIEIENVTDSAITITNLNVQSQNTKSFKNKNYQEYIGAESAAIALGRRRHYGDRNSRWEEQIEDSFFPFNTEGLTHKKIYVENNTDVDLTVSISFYHRFGLISVDDFIVTSSGITLKATEKILITSDGEPLLKHAWGGISANIENKSGVSGNGTYDVILMGDE